MKANCVLHIHQFESEMKELDKQIKELNRDQVYGQQQKDIKTVFEHAAAVRSAFVAVFTKMAEDTDAATSVNYDFDLGFMVH